MPNPTPLPRPFSDLLHDLEAAVLAGDATRARELEREILQRLSTDAAEATALELRVRELIAGLTPKPVRQRPYGELSYPGGLTRGGLEELAPGDRVVPVWFGTNRKPDEIAHGFTGERHGAVTLGRVEVLVPEAHRFGETGTPFWKRFWRFDLRDDHLRVQWVTSLERERFWGEMHQASAGQHALLYLHGYKNTFEEAAIRAAQLAADLSVSGATAFFSWPSKGSVTAYTADEAAIEASEGAITEFLVDFATHCGAEKAHVIAHSMGNRGLLRALQRIAANAEAASQVKLGQIFLAAPDVDRDLFLDLAALYPRFSERTTLYASDADLPVHLSSKLHAAPRAGYFEPMTIAPGIDTVAVPDFDLDLLGHSYFAQAQAMLHDLFDLMRHGEGPENRQRLVKAAAGDVAFWQLRR